MPTLLEKITGRSRRDQQDLLDAKTLSYRSVYFQSAQEELGQKIAKPIPEDAGFEVMKTVEPSIDGRGTINRAKQRIVWASKASRINELKKAAESAEAARLALLEKQREMARLMREQYPELNATAVRATNEYAAAVAAEQDLLSTAEVTAEETALSEQSTAIGRAIDSCKSALNRMGTTPTSLVATANHTRELLRNTKGMQPKRVEELERQLKFAEKGIAERTKELAALEKKRTEVADKLAKLAASKLKPENFAIVRRQPSRTDHLQLAAR